MEKQQNTFFQAESTLKKFSFKQVLSVVGIKPYVLRFWESEFDFIYPQINEGSDNYYSQEQLDKIIELKKALFEQKMSILEAKSHFETQLSSNKKIETLNVDMSLMEESTVELEELIEPPKVDLLGVRSKLKRALALIEKSR